MVHSGPHLVPGKRALGWYIRLMTDSSPHPGSLGLRAKGSHPGLSMLSSQTEARRLRQRELLRSESCV